MTTIKSHQDGGSIISAAVESTIHYYTSLSKWTFKMELLCSLVKSFLLEYVFLN